MQLVPLPLALTCTITLLFLAVNLVNCQVALQLTITNPEHQHVEHDLRFTSSSDPTITAHRFCSKHGISDKGCINVSTEITKALARNIAASSMPLGLYIARPTPREQIQIPSTYEFQLVLLRPEESESATTAASRTTTTAATTTCVTLRSTIVAGNEVTQRHCRTLPNGTVPSTFPLVFEDVGYHAATVEVFQQENTSVVANATVYFTSVSIEDPRAIFFDAYCDPVLSGQKPHPMTRRPMALLDQELMFRSTGTSNPGHNFPGFWLPSSGISPEWFLNYNSPVSSFLDIETKRINVTAGTVGRTNRKDGDQDGEVRQRLRKAALRVFSMINKRFDVGKTHFFCTNGKDRSIQGVDISKEFNDTTCAEARLWEKQKRQFRDQWRNDGIIDVERAHASGSGDTLQEDYMLQRFYSLRDMVVSIRLSAIAWRTNGYWQAALTVLNKAAEIGIETRPVIREDFRERVLSGICDVNEFIHTTLGFEIQGWPKFYQHACSNASIDSKISQPEL